MGSLSSLEVVEDCFGVLKLYNDGSVYRINDSEMNFEKYKLDNNTDIIRNDNSHVEFEDCIYDVVNKLNLRVYKPYSTDNNNTNKMSIVYFIHGGGFCVGSRTWPNSHNYCMRLSAQLQAIVISPDYRLAPEHRLPKGIEDGLNAVKWLQLLARSRFERDNNNYEREIFGCRLLEHDIDRVDFAKVFIIGDSSGGNIAHHLATSFGAGSPGLAPVRVCGYVLLGPFFGGVVRTASEGDGPPEPLLDLDSLDRFWRLSLPVGESRDHPSANPFGPDSPDLEKISLDPMLVIAGSNEIMKDRIEDYASRLKSLGKDIAYVESQGQHHGFYLDKPYSDASAELFTLIKQFIASKILGE